uniref:Uncharacterized protein n=1 Tax=Aegilops tauschii subsp. strangulata TaxID=200361 RepID=A0A452Y4C2_AEGTS
MKYCSDPCCILFTCSARFIGNHGFSIGVDDVQPGESLNQKKKITIDEGYEKCHELIALYSKGLYEYASLEEQPIDYVSVWI